MTATRQGASAVESKAVEVSRGFVGGGEQLHAGAPKRERGLELHLRDRFSPQLRGMRSRSSSTRSTEARNRK